MSPTNYTEQDFEEHIEEQLNNSGYHIVPPTEYDKTLCLIPSKLIEFIQETQSKTFKKLELQYDTETESKLTKRISSEIESRGVIDVLRKGVKDRGCTFHMVYFQPKSGLNPALNLITNLVNSDIHPVKTWFSHFAHRRTW